MKYHTLDGPLCTYIHRGLHQHIPRGRKTLLGHRVFSTAISPTIAILVFNLDAVSVVMPPMHRTGNRQSLGVLLVGCTVGGARAITEVFHQSCKSNYI